MQGNEDIDKPISINSPKVSDHPSDIFKAGFTQSNMDQFFKPEIMNDQPNPDEKQKSVSFDFELERVFYDTLFSPETMTDSLLRRNRNLEMHYLQRDVSGENQSIYNRRKKRVQKMEEKKKNQTHILQEIKSQNLDKYKAIMSFLELFYHIKKDLNGIRIDYYSAKTFTALKNCEAKTLKQLTKVLLTMAENLYNLSIKDAQQEIIHRKTQFMIIPRFLISKQKIKKLVMDETLQGNITHLIYSGCFGHYNNEANKKFPEEKQMSLFKVLIKQKKGKEKFKKICTINHGNKFIRTNKNEYFDLYSKSLKFLAALEHELKKGKKYENVKKQLGNVSDDSDQQEVEAKEFEYRKVSDVESVGQFLEKQSLGLQKTASLQMTHHDSKLPENKRKSSVKKLFSMQPVEITPQSERVKLKARRAFTVQDNQNYQPYVIISPPPPKQPPNDQEI